LTRPVVLGAEAAPQETAPGPAHGAELRDLLEKVAFRIQEERKPRREGVDIEAAGQGSLDGVDALVQAKGDLLGG
jgi:hypothetical protein